MLPFVLLAVSILSYLLIFRYPLLRRRRILAQPFPEAWKQVLCRKISFFDRLQIHEQQQLKDMIRLFLADKQFHGCGGLQITDEIRVTVAAEACLLLLNRKTTLYEKLQHILVYPDAFTNNREQYNEDGTVSNHMRGLLGTQWDTHT